MENKSTSVCPRCGQGFHCNRQLIQQCFCSSISTTPQQREKLTLRYRDCLCPTCLKYLLAELAAE